MKVFTLLPFFSIGSELNHGRGVLILGPLKDSNSTPVSEIQPPLPSWLLLSHPAHLSCAASREFEYSAKCRMWSCDTLAFRPFSNLPCYNNGPSSVTEHREGYPLTLSCLSKTECVRLTLPSLDFWLHSCQAPVGIPLSLNFASCVLLLLKL